MEEMILRLQRFAGNAAVGSLLAATGRAPELSVQRFHGPTYIDYEEGLARHAYEIREEKGKLNEPGLNLGILSEGDEVKDHAFSTGETQHSERRLLERVRFGEYKQRQGEEKAQIYTERHPCVKCTGLLKEALKEDDEVLYTIELTDRAKMRRELEGLINNARDLRGGKDAGPEQPEQEPAKEPGQGTNDSDAPPPARRRRGVGLPRSSRKQPEQPPITSDDPRPDKRRGFPGSAPPPEERVGEPEQPPSKSDAPPRAKRRWRVGLQPPAPKVTKEQVDEPEQEKAPSADRPHARPFKKPRPANVGQP